MRVSLTKYYFVTLSKSDSLLRAVFSLLMVNNRYRGRETPHNIDARYLNYNEVKWAANSSGAEKKGEWLVLIWMILRKGIELYISF